jgi:hypothetical protein
MRPTRLGPAAIAAALSIVLLVAMVSSGAPAFGQENAAASDLRVSVSKSEVSALTGDTFTFTSEITNTGSEVTPPLIANLDFVALDQSTYIDPEDWSPQRTLVVDPIAAGSSATQSWTVKPVLNGDVAAYVVVLPTSPALATAGPLVSSPAIYLHVEEHRALNPGGVLPVVLAVPGVLAGAFVILRVNHGRGHRKEPPRGPTGLTSY